MCGIAVLYGEENGKLLHDMMQKIKHRGPDEEGTYFSNNVSLGHTRLSIIDITTGKQPMVNDGNTKAIVFNGEIYNFLDLKKELEKDYSFKTHSDTEVILRLYELYGKDCVKYLRGMFAFAIYDNGKLFVARDRIGIKPLFMAEYDGGLAFASEMKCLNFAKNIVEFPPGSTYTTGIGFESFYSIPTPSQSDISLPEIISLIKTNVENCVQIRLVSDVPVGVFLSGGLDSSVVAAVMKKFIPELHSFTVGVEGSNDILSAGKVAEHLGTIHHEYIYDEAEMVNVLPKVIYHLESFDAPLVRSAVPNYFVSRLAKGVVKVLLSGEGADEIFCGYEYFKKYKTADEVNQESHRITSNLHNTNLQRTDRITMSHSIEARVPFLDPELIDFAFRIPFEFKTPLFNNTEKWLLRKAFEDHLPEEIVWRKKQKFSDGAGSMKILESVAESEISDVEFSSRKNGNLDFIRSKEELYYFNIFNSYYNYLDPKKVLGFTNDY